MPPGPESRPLIASSDPGDEDELSIAERLRLCAQGIAAQIGGEWRIERAKTMGVVSDDVGVGPVSRCRDSEALEESNFRVLLRSLRSIAVRT